MRNSIRVFIFILALLTALSVFACTNQTQPQQATDVVADAVTPVPTVAPTEIPAIEDVIEADSLAIKSALKYTDHSQDWMDMPVLCREFGTDLKTVMSSMDKSFIEIPDGLGNLWVAYITEMVPEGKTAPLEYSTDRIKDIILSARKHALLSGLERDLLMDARNKDRFVIY